MIRHRYLRFVLCRFKIPTVRFFPCLTPRSTDALRRGHIGYLTVVLTVMIGAGSCESTRKPDRELRLPLLGDTLLIDARTEDAENYSVHLIRGSSAVLSSYGSVDNCKSILEHHQSDSVTRQIEIDSTGAIRTINEIIVVDGAPYLNRSWSYDDYGTIQNHSIYFTIQEDIDSTDGRSSLIFKSAFPWFTDSLIFIHTGGGDETYIGKDSIVVPFTPDSPISQTSRIVGELIELEDNLDPRQKRFRRFFVNVPFPSAPATLH